MQPGQLYDSGAATDAADRLNGSPYFSGATITPIPPAGGEPDTRDVLVQVKEQNTASIGAGAAVNSNLGLNGNFSYEQRNFDVANVPARAQDLLSDQAFTGAGQTLRVNFSAGHGGDQRQRPVHRAVPVRPAVQRQQRGVLPPVHPRGLVRAARRRERDARQAVRLRLQRVGHAPGRGREDRQRPGLLPAQRQGRRDRPAHARAPLRGGGDPSGSCGACGPRT